MNVDTGELIRLQKEYAEQPPKGFIPVPDDLEEDALKVLQGQRSAFIDLKSNTPLAQFAHSQRAQREKSRRKMAKASKRRNRKKQGKRK